MMSYLTEPSGSRSGGGVYEEKAQWKFLSGGVFFMRGGVVAMTYSPMILFPGFSYGSTVMPSFCWYCYGYRVFTAEWQKMSTGVRNPSGKIGCQS
jgi:hypothetical protein